MQFELDSIKDHIVKYNFIPELPKGFELIVSQRRLFEEGNLMKHCIYTNYLNQWKLKTYIILHYHPDDITIGIDKTGKQFAVDQMYYIRNKSVGVYKQHALEALLEGYMKDFYNMCTKTKAVK